MKNKLLALGLSGLWIALFGLVVYNTVTVNKPEPTVGEETTVVQEVVIKEKSALEKQAVMKEDIQTMVSYGLYYDYSNLTLTEVVETYLAERGIDSKQVAFSYKNPETGELIGYNDTEPMTAGSTYKLPLNMLVVDGVEEGKFSMDERYDITESGYEYEGEYESYRAQFGDSMSISEMQEYSLRYSENTPAYAMAKMLGGFDAAFEQFDRYGESASDKLKTMSHNPSTTTTDYYVQVLEHLYNNQEKYEDLLYNIGLSFEGSWAKSYLPDLTIYQKPGYYAEALNVSAIMMEETPYLLSLYTAYLGDASPDNDEVSAEGVAQVGQLVYIINQWHRVNRN